MAETLTQHQEKTYARRGQRPAVATDEQVVKTITVVAAAPAVAGPAVSGLYKFKKPGGIPFDRAELRLDVDGVLPLGVASGREFAGLSQRVDWIARPLSASIGPGGQTQWSGPVSYTHGDTVPFAYTAVQIERNGQLIRVTLTGGGPDLVRDFKFSSPNFHPVEFEYDAVDGVTPVTKIGTHDHPDRPGALPDEELTIEEVYRRAGFGVQSSGGNSVVPLSLAGGDEVWSDAEMHDAMQTHWSRFADKPQWSLWTLFAALHEQGPSLGGIMFDDIGPNHRQGTALFLNSFIATVPAADPAPDAWVRRMAFWTAVHEMGHAFNLAHAWQKHLSAGPLHPWMPMTSNYELMTFMNYPYLYPDGSFSDANTAAFFREFEFRFTDEELLYLRHAPQDFVQMGNAAWFDNHGFSQAAVTPGSRFRLALRVNRPAPSFEYLEPVVVELKLTNQGGDPCVIPDMLLRSCDCLTVIVKRGNDPAQSWVPYAHQCWRSKNKVLEAGGSVYESLFLSAGHGGWLISEPGRYQVQACLRLGGEDVVTPPLTLRVAPPRGYDEEYLAQDYFADDVGRALAFDGTRVLESANAVLSEVAERFKNIKAAVHANVALAMPEVRPFKTVEFADGRALTGRGPRGRVAVQAPSETSLKTLVATLGHQPEQAQRAAETLGHIDYRYYAEKASDVLDQRGDKSQAQDARQLLYETLLDRRVLKQVTDEVHEKLDAGEEEDRKNTRRGPRGGNR